MTDAGAGTGASPLIVGPVMSENPVYSDFMHYDDDAFAAAQALNLNPGLASKPFDLQDPKAAPTTLGASDLGNAESPDSFRDSSSDSGSSKRTGSSAMTAGDVSMMDGPDDANKEWHSPYHNGAADEPPYLFGTSATDDPFAGEHFFDFDSASSSPEAPVNGGTVAVESPAMPTFSTNGARTSTTPSRSKPHPSRNQSNATSNVSHAPDALGAVTFSPENDRRRDGSEALLHAVPPIPRERLVDPSLQFPLTQPMNGLHMSGSREVSPLSQEMPSHQASPSAVFNNSPSPSNPMEFNPALYAASMAPGYWPGPVGDLLNGHHMATPFTQHQMMRLASLHTQAMPMRCQLLIKPTPAKSRVETQIPIQLTLRGAPATIKRLHLPTYTISKPKLLAKPPVDRHPDMLELYTQLVCTSAMGIQEQKTQAMHRAATASHPPIMSEEARAEEKTSGNSRDRAQNGGEVRICQGCITREQKRAGRKKIKKVEEEELWRQDESRRVIVFNTQEVKEWQTSPDGPAMTPPDLFVDAPMRIACYCRHHSEKLGFQVIFTIKDWQDNVVAQAMSPSIMITDDHKTHPGVPPPSLNTTMPEGDSAMAGSPLNTANSVGPSPSSTDLQASQRNQLSSSNKVPASMSRPVSPSSSMGPAPKKRKASGSRVPMEMTMTRLDASPPLGVQSLVPPSRASVSATTPPFTPMVNYNSPEAMFSQGGAAASIPPGFNAGAMAPNSRDPGLFSNANRSASMDNMARMFSAPTSAHHSRAPSPNTLRQGLGGVPPGSLAQGLNGMSYMPGTPGAPSPLPKIHKIVPGEGPKAGGIEVTILGSDFTEGLVVYFGEHKATTTTFWGEQSLVCLLPPASRPGPVPVTIKQAQSQSQPFTQGPHMFRYLDDEESQLAKMMLGMISQKMTGHILDVRDLAARIMNTPDVDWSSLGSASGSAAGFGTNNYTTGLESQLLKCLELIDLDDSARMPRLDLRRSATGQSMLHLGCSLGYHRFVAGLVARGANPDLRDRGGFTPMHMAALNDHEAIVRRLMQAGADPTIRSLSGLRPADLARSRKVVEHIRRCERHIRSRSGGSLHSRANSAASLRSLWDPLTSSAESNPASDGEESPEYSSGDFEDDDEEEDVDDGWLDMRRASSHPLGPGAERRTSLAHDRGDLPTEPESPTTALAAVVRDQVAAQLHQFQQAMQMHFPNFGQMPNLPQMPTFPRMGLLPNYQTYLEQSQIMGRMSSLMPNMSSSWHGSSNDEHPKPEHGKWWDFSSLLNKDAAPPPAYSEIYPRQGEAFDTKQASAALAAAEAAADTKCSKLFDTETQNVEVVEEAAEASSSTPEEPKALRIGRKAAITREQQQDFLRVHAEKFKGMRSDKNLWFIWIPLLTLILATMLYNRFPEVFTMIWMVLRSIFLGQPSQTTGAPGAASVPEERVLEVF